MTGGPDDDPPRRKRARVTGSERELWDHVARTVDPLRGKKRVPTHAAAQDDPPQRRKLPEKPPAAPSAAKTHPPAALRKPTPAAKPAPPEPVVLDRRKSRRIAKGREPIEARIDLHGMRQAEAHDTLRGFIVRCHANGLRRVLVITGKGTATDARDDWTMGERERGVLRRNVPRWLAEPGLAALVSAVAPAHARHGGDGALYVMLRRGGGC